jgi:hypothetical protein
MRQGAGVMVKWFFMTGVLLLMPTAARAHIKWFCAYDTSMPPTPLGDVFTSTFAIVALGFCGLMFIAYVLDGRLAGCAWAGRLDGAILTLESHTSTLIRAAVGILFFVLWASGGTILMPELQTTNTAIPWLQLAIAASMLARSTLVFGALGIMLLYGYAVVTFGAFHMMDYPVVPGVAVYVALTACNLPRIRALRMPVFFVSVALTMMWGAVEKFAYPYWTFPLLTTHAALTVGFSFEQFMYIAGFVEFSLAFFMLTGTVLLRLACAALLMLLLSAIPEFGKVDAIGHLLIIAGLVTMIITGQHSIQLPALVSRGGIAIRAGLLTSSYVATLAAAFVLYYGSQFVAGR